jgi:hypothetical protein
MQETMQNRLISPPKLFNEAHKPKDLPTFDRYVYIFIYLYVYEKFSLTIATIKSKTNIYIYHIYK